MNAITPIPLGQIIPVPNMRVPRQGSQMMPFLLDFTNTGALEGSLRGAFDSGEFDFAQSVWIDNKNNNSTVTISFPGAGPKGQDIQAQPLTQGYYPVSPVVGDGRFTATTTQGQTVPIAFYNVPMPYFTWGPVPGVLIVPALTNSNRIDAIGGAGDLQLVPGVALKTIKLYRAVLSVDSPTVVKFTDGPGGAIIAPPATLTAGGSLTLQPSGVQWGTTSAGNDLTLNFSAACNSYLGIGYVQS